MTDEELAALLAKSHAALVAAFMEALQMDWAPPAPTERPVVERCEVAMCEEIVGMECEVVERCEVV